MSFCLSLFPIFHQEAKHWSCTLKCAYLQHASSKEKPARLSSFPPVRCVKISWPLQEEVAKPAGGSAHFLISLPSHRIVAFLTHFLPLAFLSPVLLFSRPSPPVRAFTPFPSCHLSLYVAVYFCSHSVVWRSFHFLLLCLIFSLSTLHLRPPPVFLLTALLDQSV